MDEFHAESADQPEQQPTVRAEAGPPTQDERNLAVLAHLLGLLAFMAPGGNVVGPLAVWLIKREASAYIARQALESLNFQVTMTLLAVASVPLACVGIGFVLLPIVAVLGLVFPIIAAVAASRGEDYRYPLTLRLIS